MPEVGERELEFFQGLVARDVAGSGPALALHDTAGGKIKFQLYKNSFGNSPSSFASPYFVLRLGSTRHSARGDEFQIKPTLRDLCTLPRVRWSWRRESAVVVETRRGRESRWGRERGATTRKMAPFSPLYSKNCRVSVNFWVFFTLCVSVILYRGRELA